MPESSGNAALFLDLGGTLIKLDETQEIPQDSNGSVIVELLDNVADRLRPMREYLMFVVTNQSKIKRGRFTMDQIEDALRVLDQKLGDILTAWKVCPHDDADGCECRKPKCGMITELAGLYGVDLSNSIMVGDSPADEGAARAAGVKFIHARDFFGWR